MTFVGLLAFFVASCLALMVVGVLLLRNLRKAQGPRLARAAKAPVPAPEEDIRLATPQRRRSLDKLIVPKADASAEDEPPLAIDQEIEQRLAHAFDLFENSKISLSSFRAMVESESELLVTMWNSIDDPVIKNLQRDGFQRAADKIDWCLAWSEDFTPVEKAA